MEAEPTATLSAARSLDTDGDSDDEDFDPLAITLEEEDDDDASDGDGSDDDDGSDEDGFSDASGSSDSAARAANEDADLQRAIEASRGDRLDLDRAREVVAAANAATLADVLKVPGRRKRKAPEDADEVPDPEEADAAELRKKRSASVS